MVSEESNDPLVRPVFERLKQRWGKVLYLYRILAWSPHLLQGWAAFAWMLRFELNAPRKLRELMIVRLAGLLNARYEYEHHRRMAHAEGVDEEQLAALSNWRDCNLFSESEKLVLALADDIALHPRAQPQTMAGLQAVFPNQQVVEFLVTACFYRGVAGIVNSLELEPETEPDLLPKQ